MKWVQHCTKYIAPKKKDFINILHKYTDNLVIVLWSPSQEYISPSQLAWISGVTRPKQHVWRCLLRWALTKPNGKEIMLCINVNMNDHRLINRLLILRKQTVFYWMKIQPSRRELKIRRAAEYFWRNSRCLDSRWNTVSSVSYIFSIETKTKE